MNKIEAVIKVVAKAILIDQAGKILLLRRSKTDTRRPGQWDFPGGTVEKGEYVEAACIREIFEESGIIVEKDNLQLFWSDADMIVSDADGVALNVVWTFFYAKVLNVEPRLSFEHDRFGWMEPKKALEEIKYQRHVTMLRYAMKYKLL